jgi:hypothetical protein
MVDKNIKGIGVCANTLLSFAIVDGDVLEHSHNVLSSQDIFLCFGTAELYQILSKANLPIPDNLIDLKVELSLLNNEIGLSGNYSWLKFSLSDIVLASNISPVAPDGTIWTNFLQSKSSLYVEQQSKEIALRHASWLIDLWEKHRHFIDIDRALKRAHYSKCTYQISIQGFPVDIKALNNTTVTEAVSSRNITKNILDERCYSQITPWGTTTGRNSTSSSDYPLSIKTEYRKWFTPASGRCFLHLDYHRAEIGIAAALSQDKNLLDLYINGDPYLWFAQQCTPAIELKKAKHLFISFQYGAMPSRKLIGKISLPAKTVKHLYSIHQAHFNQYWSWTETVIENACFDGFLTVPDGWRVAVTSNSSVLSIINFPTQAMGALILREVVRQLGEQHILPIGLNHDAVLFECACDEATKLTQQATKVMQNVSQNLLGLELKVSVDIGQSGQSLFEVLEK